MKDIFAVFAVAQLRRTTLLCATTRPDGTIGLPGGKVDPGEDIFQAVIREAEEEGWNLTCDKKILRTGIVDGKKVAWIRCYTTETPVKSQWKEKYRGIFPLAIPVELLSPGMGNEFLK
jgi:hypothetical protein